MRFAIRSQLRCADRRKRKAACMFPRSTIQGSASRRSCSSWRHPIVRKRTFSIGGRDRAIKPGNNNGFSFPSSCDAQQRRSPVWDVSDRTSNWSQYRPVLVVEKLIKTIPRHGRARTEIFVHSRNFSECQAGIFSPWEYCYLRTELLTSRERKTRGIFISKSKDLVNA